MSNYGNIVRRAASGRSIPSFNSTNFNASVKSVATAFTGGINLDVLPTSISDEQSPDMLNMWYKDGMLRTRPGITAKTGVTNKSKKAVNDALIANVRAVTSPYIPTIFTNCNSRGGGNQYEDRNMLTPRVKMSFSPSGGDKTFKLADTRIDYAEIDITYHCPLYDYDEHYVIPSSDGYCIYQSKTTGIWYQVNANYVTGILTWYRLKNSTKDNKDDTWPGFTDSADYNVIDELVVNYSKTIYSSVADNADPYVSGTSYIQYSLVIKDKGAVYECISGSGSSTTWVDSEWKYLYQRNPVLECTKALYYGGSLSGLGNGANVILTGDSYEPNKYYWSQTNDISYWPVNNFNSCGDSSEAITALAKQSNYLIAFTANKTYKIQYNSEQPANTSVPYEEFPRSLLHSTIGCDCPDTIELVDNCLTWLNSDGNVYRLVTINNTIETAIVPISQNIGKAIKALTKAQLQTATACDTGRYYIIFANTKAFAWNYDGVSFINYSSSEKAQDRLIWFLWGMPAIYTDAFYDGNIELNGGAYGMDETIGSDLGATFSAYVYTKKFDFGAPLNWKSVFQQSFRVISDDGNITMKIVDNNGAIDLSQTITVSTLPQFIQNRQTSMTDYYQGYISRPTNLTSKFAVSEFVAQAQIAAQM